MNIIITTPVLYDEKSPFNHLFKDVLEGFLYDENKITRIVACENPNDKRYTLGIEHENIDHIEVKRVKHSKGNIIMRYITDNITNIKMAWNILCSKEIDILFEDVSYSSFWSVFAAKTKKIKVVSMIQDVWPDNAVKSGLIKEESIIYRYFELWQRYVYRYSDSIICVSEDIKEFIASKGIEQNKIKVIYNWGYSDELIDIKWEDNKFVKEHNLSPKTFYAVYAGNIGKMQNVELVVNAAKLLKDKANIHFLIIGDGVKKDEIAEFIIKENMKNVTLLSMQPSEMATSIYSMANVNIIPLVKGGVKTALPSKTGVCLSCGRPVLLCMEKNSKISNLIEQTNSGVAVEPDDCKMLAQTITDFANGKINIKKQDVWKCFADNFTQKANINKYKTIVGA